MSDPRAGGARPATVRRQLRSSRSPDARVSAADLPHDAAAPGRRVARSAADDQELLRDDERHHHARADGRPAAVAHAVPPRGVQPDRRPQGRRAEPGRHLPRLPLEFPHQRGVPPDSRRAAAGGALPARHDEPARHVQPADPRLEAVAALDRGLHRIRAAHGVLQWRPCQRARARACTCRTGRTRSR